jgi:hypothetical protein
MLVGVLVSFWVGCSRPGGATTLALMPFIYNMQPVEAFAFLRHARGRHHLDPVRRAGRRPPRRSSSTACDGESGQQACPRSGANRSLIGGAIGAASPWRPIVRPLVLTFGSPGLFMLSSASPHRLAGTGARAA